MLQQEGPPDDFVIATGRHASVRCCIELAASELGGGGIQWQVDGPQEAGSRLDTEDDLVRMIRPIPAPRKLKRCWVIPPELRKAVLDTQHHSVGKLVAEMVAADREVAQKRLI